VVYIGDVSQGRFPWNRGWSLDEELRLAYVAITRAREHCTLTCSEQPDSVESSIFSQVSKAIARTSGY
jgi:superfamily I DNA/RNA helicase